MKRLVCRLEPDQSEPIWFVIDRGQLDATVLQLFPVEMLEADLDELDCVLGLDFSQVEDDQVKHLLHLHRVLLVFVLLQYNLLDDWSEAKFYKRFHSLKYISSRFIFLI